MSTPSELDRTPASIAHRATRRRSCAIRGALLAVAIMSLRSADALSAEQPSANQATTPATTTDPASLQGTRTAMETWIKVQQLISQSRNEWQRAKEVLIGRIELVKAEVASLERRIDEARLSAVDTGAEREKLTAENDQLKQASAQLAEAVTGMEERVRVLFTSLPEPIQAKVKPLIERIPEDAATMRVSVAERFQNVLGILGDVNKANNEILVNVEYRALGDNATEQVETIYLGLAQAYYVSPRGEAGVGRPTADGWTWQPSNTASRDVLTALEILKGRHAPAFVPLPVTLQ